MNRPGHNGDPPSGTGGSPGDRFGSGDEGPGLPAVVVPDDLSELDAEVQEYRREIRRARRRARLSTIFIGPFRWIGRGFKRFLRLFRLTHPD